MPEPNESPSRWRFFSEPYLRAEQDAREHVADSTSLDFKVMLVLFTTAVVLTLQHYVFSANRLTDALNLAERLGAAGLAEALRRPNCSAQDRQLAELIYWALGSLITYVAIPAAIVKLVFRQRLSDYGWKLRGMLRGAWIYLAFFAVMVPPLLLFAETERFQQTYPFYRLGADESLWPRFWIWEAFYVMQFFCLEFFFRGFMVHGTRHRFGFYAVFVMMVPYCMIHYGKPMPETFGAIGAGIALGFMSLKTRSVILGAVLHVSVALSMDFLSLWSKGFL